MYERILVSYTQRYPQYKLVINSYVDNFTQQINNLKL
jgi:hypothetical protein